MTVFDFSLIEARIDAAVDARELDRIGRAVAGAFIGPTTQLERLIAALDRRRSTLRREHPDPRGDTG